MVCKDWEWTGSQAWRDRSLQGYLFLQQASLQCIYSAVILCLGFGFKVRVGMWCLFRDASDYRKIPSLSFVYHSSFGMSLCESRPENSQAFALRYCPRQFTLHICHIYLYVLYYCCPACPCKTSSLKLSTNISAFLVLQGTSYPAWQNVWFIMRLKLNRLWSEFAPQEDFIGLRHLETGYKLEFGELEGHHMQFSKKDLVDKIILPYFKTQCTDDECREVVA